MRRRQAGEVERHAADERFAGRFGRGRQFAGEHRGEGQAVDLVARPAGVFCRDRRDLCDVRSRRRDESPVLLPLRPRCDPASQHVDLRLRQPRIVGVRRRHLNGRIRRGHAAEEFALVGRSRHDHAVLPLGVLQQSGPQIEPQLPLTAPRIRPVALEALVGQDRPHLSGKVHRWIGREERNRVEAQPDHEEQTRCCRHVTNPSGANCWPAQSSGRQQFSKLRWVRERRGVVRERVGHVFQPVRQAPSRLTL